MNWNEFLNLGIAVMNAVAFILFIGLLGAAVFKMAARWATYLAHKRQPSIILRRDMALLGALFLVFGSMAVIRFFGWGDWFEANALVRFLYLAVIDCVAIGALGYWTWAEYFVIGQPGHEED